MISKRISNKHILTFSIYLLLLPLMILFSCSTEPEQIELKEVINIDTLENFNSPIEPGDVGSYWKYKVFKHSQPIRYDDDTLWTYNNFSSFLFDFSDTKVSVWDSTKREIGGEFIVNIADSCFYTKAYFNKSLSYERQDTVFWLYWSGENGIYEMGGYSQTDTLLAKGLKTPYPIKRGDIWHGLSITYDGYIFNKEPSILRKCVAENEKLVTPYFTFDNCIVILDRRSPGEDVGGYDDYYFYYAPNIGLVCYVHNYTDPIYGSWRIESVSIVYEYKIK